MNRVKMADFLIELRKEKNLLQQEVAEIFMVTTQAVSKWERGESIPDISILERMSEFYGVTIEEILNGERKELHQKKETAKRSINFFTAAIPRSLWDTPVSGKPFTI